jgi:type VI secretion system protein ImpB
MDKDTTLPRDRLNIVYRSADEKEFELPLRMLFVGDFMGRDERPIEDRVPIRVDKDTFARVLAAHAPRLDLLVASARTEDGTAVRASLTFRRLADFAPDAIAAQIPEVSRLLSLRDALSELKNAGDVTAFRAQLESLISDAAARERLLLALGLGAA